MLKSGKQWWNFIHSGMRRERNKFKTNWFVGGITRTFKFWVISLRTKRIRILSSSISINASGLIPPIHAISVLKMFHLVSLKRKEKKRRERNSSYFHVKRGRTHIPPWLCRHTSLWLPPVIPVEVDRIITRLVVSPDLFFGWIDGHIVWHFFVNFSTLFVSLLFLPLS